MLPPIGKIGRLTMTFIAAALLLVSPVWAGGSVSKAVADDLPTAIGECMTSSIVEITGRLQGDTDFDSGTAVVFANDGWQVSYDRELAIIGSRVGDPVEICLVELPQDCPPGDERGKIYTTTNLRTGESWTLPDSQHSCGGA